MFTQQTYCHGMASIRKTSFLRNHFMGPNLQETTYLPHLHIIFSLFKNFQFFFFCCFLLASDPMRAKISNATSPSFCLISTKLNDILLVMGEGEYWPLPVVLGTICRVIFMSHS